MSAYYLRKWFDPTFFNCAWCDEEFVASDAIELHVKQVHPFNCYNCVKSLATWHDLLSHAEVCSYSRSTISFFVSSCVGGSLTDAPIVKK
jgi:transcription elongation factor Elf1